MEEARALVSTRGWADGSAALHAYRPRWHSENAAYRALQEGWGREEQQWGREVAALHGRLTLTCLACTTAQVERSRAGERLATRAMRRMRQRRQAEWGAVPAVIDVEGCSAVLALEERLVVLGTPVRERLLPAGAAAEAHRPP